MMQRGIKAALPASHTLFSWSARRTAARIPLSHTRFSWCRQPPGSFVVPAAAKPQSSSSSVRLTSSNSGDGSGSGSGSNGIEKDADTDTDTDYLIDVDANFLSDDLAKDGDVTFHISAARQVGVRQFIVPSYSAEDISKVLELTAETAHQGVMFPCVGVHPYVCVWYCFVCLQQTPSTRWLARPPSLNKQ